MYVCCTAVAQFAVYDSWEESVLVVSEESTSAGRVATMAESKVVVKMVFDVNGRPACRLTTAVHCTVSGNKDRDAHVKVKVALHAIVVYETAPYCRNVACP
jgi:hypothetical protein